MVTVGATAVTSVVVVNATTITAEGASTRLRGRRPRHGSDDLRHRADRGEAVSVGATAATSVVVVNGKTITAVTPSMSRAMSL
ncbi:MAG: hypothetical protein ACJ8EL_21665 [Rhizomicrobium sp.]